MVVIKHGNVSVLVLWSSFLITGSLV